MICKKIGTWSVALSLRLWLLNRFRNPRCWGRSSCEKDTERRLGAVAPFAGARKYGLYDMVFWKTKMAAAVHRFLLQKTWFSCVEMSAVRAAIHTSLSLASSHGDPLVGVFICFYFITWKENVKWMDCDAGYFCPTKIKMLLTSPQFNLLALHPIFQEHWRFKCVKNWFGTGVQTNPRS